MEVFSMSFLDCMSCGFGAVILFFMIINSQAVHESEAPPERAQAEVTKLEFEILEERKNLVMAHNTMEELEDEQLRAEDRIAQIIALIEQLKKELEEYDSVTLAKIERIEKLQSDIERLEQEKQRLLAQQRENEGEGSRVRQFIGDGDRQYLTGLRVGGDRILVLVDSSASMLERTVDVETGVNWQHADLNGWQPDHLTDVVYSNAHIAKVWTLEPTALSDARQALVSIRAGKELKDRFEGPSMGFPSL